MAFSNSASFTTGAIPVMFVGNQGLLGDMSAVSINSITTVLTPTTGKTLRILGGAFSLSADASVLFEDNAAATANFIFRSPLLLAKYPYTFWIGQGKLLAAVNNVLKATASAAATITGVIYYAEQ
jgi:hypothetical protein